MNETDVRQTVASFLRNEFATALEGIVTWIHSSYEGWNQDVYPISRIVAGTLLHSRWPWAFYQALRKSPWPYLFVSRPTAPPTDEDGELLGDDWLISELVQHPASDPLALFAVKRWQINQGEVRLVRVDDYSIGALNASGEFVVKDSLPRESPQLPGTYPVTLAQSGWWNVDAPGWCGPTVYEAVTYLKGASIGNVQVGSELVAYYSRHPTRGYPRFRFDKHFEIPIWTPQAEGIGWLELRLEALRLLYTHGWPAPPQSLCMNVRLGQTQQQAPRLLSANSGTECAFFGCFASPSPLQGSRVLYAYCDPAATSQQQQYQNIIWLAEGDQISVSPNAYITYDKATGLVEKAK